MNDEDAELVRAVLAGQDRAFARLVQRHQRLVWHVVQRLVRDREDTRDLCQETFLRVHRRLHQYRGESSLATWIGRVAYTVALRHLEKKRIDIAQPQDDDAPALFELAADPLDLEAAAANAQQHQRLHRAIESLAPLQRTLLTLYHFEALPIADIASITGLAGGTIKSHLFRSRLQLRKLLVDMNPGNTGHD